MLWYHQCLEAPTPPQNCRAGPHPHFIPRPSDLDLDPEDPPWATPAPLAGMRIRLLAALCNTNWHPSSNLHNANAPLGPLSLWQDQPNTATCLCTHTNYRSILTSRYRPANTRNSLHTPLPRLATTALPEPAPPLCRDVVHMWTDGSATNNGSEACKSTTMWVSEDGSSGHCWITGAPSSNNIAEIVAATLALHNWPNDDLHIHTDSKLVLALFQGGLLALENSGWSTLPWVAFGPLMPPQSHTELHQFLLYLARSHQGTLEVLWVKAHTGDPMNEAADRWAKAALTSPDTVDILAFCPPPGWVDTPPTLCGWTLTNITKSIVHDTTIPPFSKACCAPTLTKWPAHMLRVFGHHLDTGTHLGALWSTNIPSSLKELLWKEVTRSLPLSPTWFSDMALGHNCCCGALQSLTHIWHGCPMYNLTPLLRIVQNHILPSPDQPLTMSEDPALWGHPWFLLVTLHSLEHSPHVSKKPAKRLQLSCPEWEWAIGMYLWMLWVQKMKEVHNEGYFADPLDLRQPL